MSERFELKDVSTALYRYFCCSFAAHIAQDLVQDTLVRLIDKVNRGRFNAQLGNLRMYAFGIAHFVRLEAVRDHELNSRHDPESEVATTDAEEQFADQQQIKQLRQAIRTLSEIQQQVIGLYLDKDMTNEEIGLILNLPTGTIKSHISRAKDALKDKLRG